MQQVGQISFTDLDSEDEGIIIVQAREGRVALTASLKENGDVSVFLNAEDCTHLIYLLHQAIGIASKADPNQG